MSFQPCQRYVEPWEHAEVFVVNQMRLLEDECIQYILLGVATDL